MCEFHPFLCEFIDFCVTCKAYERKFEKHNRFDAEALSPVRVGRDPQLDNMMAGEPVDGWRDLEARVPRFTQSKYPVFAYFTGFWRRRRPKYPI